MVSSWWTSNKKAFYLKWSFCYILTPLHLNHFFFHFCKQVKTSPFLVSQITHRNWQVCVQVTCSPDYHCFFVLFLCLLLSFMFKIVAFSVSFTQLPWGQRMPMMGIMMLRIATRMSLMRFCNSSNIMNKPKITNQMSKWEVVKLKMVNSVTTKMMLPWQLCNNHGSLQCRLLK